MKSAERILVVDDDRIVLMGFEGILKAEGFEVTSVLSGKEATALLEKETFDLVLTDLVLQDMDGIAILSKAREVNSETVVIVITGFASVNSAIEALRQGAFDYLIKPCDDEEILIRVRRGLEQRQLVQKVREQELQEERLKAITQTAVTVNDQINTPLNVIQASAEYLRGAIEEDDDTVKESLNFIESEVSKIKEVVSNLAKIVDPRIKHYAIDEITMVDLDSSTIDKPNKKKGKEPTGASILVGDDEEFMLQSLSKLLSLMDFKTETANCGEKALQVMKNKSFDLIITDINMPGMSGMDLLKQVKAKDPHLPVIIITGFGAEKAKEMAEQNNADGFLPKPFRMNDIKDMIDKILINCLTSKPRKAKSPHGI
jgi:DNA-binding NtrC family response regulator